MIDFNINNEISRLEKVVVGSAYDFGGTPEIDECYDPKSIQHVLEGTFPKEECLLDEMKEFVDVLEKYNIEVLRPDNIPDLNQIFVRDLAFVVNDKIVISNMIKNRRKEIEALEILFNGIDSKRIIKTPKQVRIEGGDVILSDEFIFIGYSRSIDFSRYTVARTNEQAISFLQTNFPNSIVKAFELNKSDNNPKENALHLDCCFQPIGKNMAILYAEGFKNKEDVDFLINHYGDDNIIYITREEMYNMNANLFSISDNVIVSEKDFVRLNRLLVDKGFIVEEVKYSEVAKMEGLFRCSTMPLIRK